MDEFLYDRDIMIVMKELIIYGFKVLCYLQSEKTRVIVLQN